MVLFIIWKAINVSFSVIFVVIMQLKSFNGLCKNMQQQADFLLLHKYVSLINPKICRMQKPNFHEHRSLSHTFISSLSLMIMTNQRPLFMSRDNFWPIRGQYLCLCWGWWLEISRVCPGYCYPWRGEIWAQSSSASSVWGECHQLSSFQGH